MHECKANKMLSKELVQHYFQLIFTAAEINQDLGEITKNKVALWDIAYEAKVW